MENKILEKFGKEPDANEYTAQDVYEQIRKIIQNQVVLILTHSF